jgi:hypothetical protein
MLPHHYDFTGPNFDRSFSFMPSASFPRYTPSSFVGRSARAPENVATPMRQKNAATPMRNIIASDLPQSNKEQVRSAVPISYDQVLSKLKPLMDGVPTEREITIKGVSMDVIDMLREKGNSELCLKNLRYHRLSSSLSFL